MKPNRALLLLGVSVVTLAICACLLQRLAHDARNPRQHNEAFASIQAKSTLPGDRLYASDPQAAAREYDKFLASNAKSPDPKVQDEVARVRIRLAYLKAKAGDLEGSRKTLLTAVSQYRGAGTWTADFGGPKDQAAYQAAVCLVAEHHEEDAAREFRAFLHDYSLSPLVHAAYRRLERLGVATEADRDALQAAVSAQEAHIQQEMAMCGPKCVVKLLGLLRHPAPLPDYHAVARLCGTTSKGTSIAGLRRGLRALGLMSYAFELNRRDFQGAPLPAILFSKDHYLLITQIQGTQASAYDPLTGKDQPFELPPLDNPDFTATLITLRLPNLDTRP